MIKNKDNVYFIITILVCIIVISIAISVAFDIYHKKNSNSNNKPNDVIFIDPALNPVNCAVASNKKEYVVENVLLSFSFGIYYLGDVGECHTKIYFINNLDVEYIIREFDDFKTEKYLCTPVFDSNFYTVEYYEFNHSENIQVPGYLFDADKGFIKFCVEAEGIDKTWRFCNYCKFNYEKKDDKIIIGEILNYVW